jgi:hypothetical protein
VIEISLREIDYRAAAIMVKKLPGGGRTIFEIQATGSGLQESDRFG